MKFIGKKWISDSRWMTSYSAADIAFLKENGITCMFLAVGNTYQA